METNQRTKREYPNEQNQKQNEGHNNRHRGNPENHQVILQNVYSTKFENLKEMGNSFDGYDIPK